MTNGTPINPQAQAVLDGRRAAGVAPAWQTTMVNVMQDADHAVAEAGAAIRAALGVS